MVGNNSSTRSSAASEAVAVVRLADQLGKSLLQDLRRGRRTEVRQLNGVIAELGRSVGVETPLNALMVRTVLAIEAGALRSGTERLSQVTRALEATYA